MSCVESSSCIEQMFKRECETQDVNEKAFSVAKDSGDVKKDVLTVEEARACTIIYAYEVGCFAANLDFTAGVRTSLNSFIGFDGPKYAWDFGYERTLKKLEYEKNQRETITKLYGSNKNDN